MKLSPEKLGSAKKPSPCGSRTNEAEFKVPFALSLVWSLAKCLNIYWNIKPRPEEGSNGGRCVSALTPHSSTPEFIFFFFPFSLCFVRQVLTKSTKTACDSTKKQHNKNNMANSNNISLIPLAKRRIASHRDDYEGVIKFPKSHLSSIE